MQNNINPFKKVLSQRSDNLHLLLSNTTFANRRVHAMASKLFNKLPPHGKDCKNSHEMKLKLFHLLGNKAYYSIYEFMGIKLFIFENNLHYGSL